MYIYYKIYVRYMHIHEFRNLSRLSVFIDLQERLNIELQERLSSMQRVETPFTSQAPICISYISYVCDISCVYMYMYMQVQGG